MTRLLMVSTIATTLSTFLLPHVRCMQHEGWIVDGVANGIASNQDCVNTFNSIYEIEWSRSPLDVVHMIKAMKRIKEIVEKGGYDIVHVHTPIASAVTRFALRHLVEAKKIKMMYTAHGFHFYKGARWLNWLVYYPIEKYLSRYTDVLITINKEDYAIAKNKMCAKQTEYVPGVGIDVDKINNISVDKNQKRRALGIPVNAIVLLSVGELNKNKNHEVVIRAIAQLKRDDIIYVICGRGILEDYLKKLAQKLGIFRQTLFLGFRTDIIEIAKASDVFVLPSLREGLPVALMEAMACSLPIVCSDIRGNSDLIDNGIGYRFNPHDVDSLLTCLNAVISQPRDLINYEVLDQISLKNVEKDMRKIYFLNI